MANNSTHIFKTNFQIDLTDIYSIELALSTSYKNHGVGKLCDGTCFEKASLVQSGKL